MKIYESRLTWIIGYIIVTSLFCYNFIVLPFGFIWFIKVLICSVCSGIIFWTKLFKEYPKKQPTGVATSEFWKNEREEIWNNNDNNIWNNNEWREDVWRTKTVRIRR